MFTLTRIKYQLIRLPGRTFLLLLTAMVLFSGMGMYLVNLHDCQSALDSLAESVPVTIRVVNRSGTRYTRLAIKAEHFDALTSQDVHSVSCTANAAGAFESQAEDTFSGGDTAVTAANDILAVPAVSADTIRFAEGYDPDFLTGAEAICGVSEEYAREMSLALGDELTLFMYAVHYSPVGARYIPIGEQNLHIKAVYPYVETNGVYSPDIIVPVAWLRAETERTGEEFTYSSLSVVLDDPLHLNSFKEKLQFLGFVHVSSGDTSDAISVEDELFIKTAEELMDHLQLYKIFQGPFFALIILLVMLTVFLALRSNRRNIAIALSLGEPKIQITFVEFISTMLTQLTGGVAAGGILVLCLSISLVEVLTLLLAFELCAAIGVVLALARLMNFEAIALLIKAD